MAIEQQQEYVIGLDLGSTSVGWALVQLKDGDPVSIMDMGVRRFDAGVEGDIESGRDESRATQRRDKRGPRRQIWRRQWRMRKVFRLLCENGLLPEAADNSGDVRNEIIAKLDLSIRGERLGENTPNRIDDHLLPYVLRRDALDNPLPAHHLGRAFYHLAQRRGFLSNRKAAGDDEETGVVKKGIGELAEAINTSGSRTLGEFFSTLDPEETRIRKRWTSRAMYTTEFEAIWDAQQAHHECLTQDLKDQLSAAIFYQRPLKSQNRLIGRCSLETERRRAPLACLDAQRIRYLQKLNDLEVIHPDGEIRDLTVEERAMLVEVLERSAEMTFGAIRKLLGMKKSKEYGRNYIFNFEEGGDKRLIGNRTGAKLTEHAGDKWTALSRDQKRELVDEILSFESEAALATRLEKAWNMSAEEAVRVADIIFEPGYHNLSRKAISRLLPLMEQGQHFATARKEIYGESLADQQAHETLPAYSEVNVDLRNPAVSRALSELRKVVNAIIRTHGKPALVRIELARDLKHSRKVRQDITKRNKDNEKLRANADQKILADMKHDRYVTRDNILKVRLADECGWTCPYTGKTISMRALVGDSPQFDIEHTIPFSRSLDNSFLNKTLCHHEENRNIKKNRTPYEAYGELPKYEEILQRVRFFSGSTARHKLELFKTQQLPSSGDFSSRQLNDTRYIAKLAGNYLGMLFGGQIDSDGKRRVQVSPGRATAYLRQRWQLNSLIGHSDVKERDDHRHHAIDAVVVALTDPFSVRLLSRAAERAEEYGGKLFADVDLPWENFLKEAREAVESITVSSRVSRKLNGSLHKDTNLSKPISVTDDAGKPTAVHHVRKSLDALSPGEVNNIVDRTIRHRVQEVLEAVGGTPDKAFQEEANLPHINTGDGRVVIIRSVRITKSDKPMAVGRGSSTRYVNPGSNHHMEIVAKRDDNGDEIGWEGIIVSRFEAMQRHRRDEPIIQTNHLPEGEFVFSLTGGEHVVMVNDQGKEQLYRVTVISGNRVECVLHRDARPTTERRKIKGARISRTANSLHRSNARKVTVTPLGEILPAND